MVYISSDTDRIGVYDSRRIYRQTDRQRDKQTDTGSWVILGSHTSITHHKSDTNLGYTRVLNGLQNNKNSDKSQLQRSECCLLTSTASNCFVGQLISPYIVTSWCLFSSVINSNALDYTESWHLGRQSLFLLHCVNSASLPLVRCYAFAFPA